MYYRVYYPTCVERKFGNISKKIATKCLIPSSQNETLHYNSKLATNQIPTINLHMKTVARSDSVRTSERSSLKQNSHSFIHYIKRNEKVIRGEYCNCCDNNKTVSTLVEHSPKCCCQRHFHNKPSKTYRNQIKHKICSSAEKHQNMQHRKLTGKCSKIDSKKLISNDRNKVSDKNSEFKYKVCGKNLQGHVNIKVAGINNLESKIEKNECIHSYNLDPICSQLNNDDSMNFLFYDTNSDETSSRYCINNGESNNEMKKNLGVNSYYQKLNGDHCNDINELQLNYKNEVIKFDSISTSCKSICVDSKFKCEKSFIEISSNNRKRDKPVANYLHNVMKRKRKISTKIFGKLKKFTDSKRHLAEKSAAEERHCEDNPGNFPSLSGSNMERDRFDQLGCNYISDGSETNILRNNLELLQEKFRIPNTVLQTQKGCGSKMGHRSDYYYFDVTEPYQTNEIEKQTKRPEELQIKEINRIQKNSLLNATNRFSLNDSVSPNTCLKHDPICKNRNHLKIKRQNIKKNKFAMDVSNNLQDISKLLKIVHQQHKNLCSVKNQIVRMKCIPHERKFHAVHRILTKNKSIPRSSKCITNVEEWSIDDNLSDRNSEKDLSALYHNEKQHKTTALSSVNLEPNNLNEYKKVIGWKTDSNNLNKLEEGYLKGKKLLNYELNETDSAEIGSQGSAVYVMKINSSSCSNLAQEESDGNYFVKQINESDITHQRDINKRMHMNLKPEEQICSTCGSINNYFKGGNQAPLKVNKKPMVAEEKKSGFCNDFEKVKHGFSNDCNYFTLANRTVEAYWTCYCGNSNPNLTDKKTESLKQGCSCADTGTESSTLNQNETCCCYDSQDSVKKVELKHACRCDNDDNSLATVKEIKVIEQESFCSGDDNSVKEIKSVDQACCCGDDDNSLTLVKKNKNVEQLNSCVKKPEKNCFCSDSIREENISEQGCFCYNTPPKRLIRKFEKPEPKNESTQLYTIKIKYFSKPTQTCNCYSLKKDVPVQTSKISLRSKEQISKKVQTLQFDTTCDNKKHKKKYASEGKCICYRSKDAKVDEPLQTRKKVWVDTSTASTSSYDSLVKSLGEECNKSESGSTTILSDYEYDTQKASVLSLTSSYDSIVICQFHGKRPCQCNKKQLMKTNLPKRMPSSRDSYCMSTNRTRAICDCYSKEKSTPRAKNSSKENCIGFKRNERDIRENQITNRNIKPTRMQKASHNFAKDEPTERCGCKPRKKNLSKEEYSSSDVRPRSGRNTTCTCTSSSPDPPVRDYRRNIPSLPYRSSIRRRGKREVCLFATVISEGDDTSEHMYSSLENLTSDTIKSHESVRRIEMLKDINSQNCSNSSLKKHFHKETTPKPNKKENVLVNQTRFQNSNMRCKELQNFKDFISPAEAERAIIEQNKSNDREIYVEDVALKNQHHSETYFITSANAISSDSISRIKRKMLTQVSVNRDENHSSEFATSNFTKSVSSSNKRGMENEKTGVQKYSSQATSTFSDSKRLKDSQEPEKLETGKTKTPAESLIEKTEHNEEEDVKCSYTVTHSHLTGNIPSLVTTIKKSGSRAEYVFFKVPNQNYFDKDKMKNMGSPILLSPEKEDKGPKNKTLNFFDKKDDSSKNDYASSDVTNPTSFEKVEIIPVLSEKEDSGSKKKTLSILEIKHGSRTNIASTEVVNTNIYDKIKMGNMGVPILESSPTEKGDGPKKENIDTDHDKTKTHLLALPTKEDYLKKNFISANTKKQSSFTAKFEVPEIETSNENVTEISEIKDEEKRFKVTIKVKHQVTPKDHSSEEFIQDTSQVHIVDMGRHEKGGMKTTSLHNVMKHQVTPKDHSSEEFIQDTSQVHIVDMGRHEKGGMKTTSLHNVTVQPNSPDSLSLRWNVPKKYASLSLLSDLQSKDTIRPNEMCKEELLSSKLLACKENSCTFHEGGKRYWLSNSLDKFNICDQVCDEKTTYSEADCINYNESLDINDECFVKDSINFSEENSCLEKSLCSTSLPEIKCNGGNYNNSVVIINNYICKSEQSTKYSYDIVTNSANVVKHKEKMGGHPKKNENSKKQNELINDRGVSTSMTTQPSSKTGNQAIKRT